MSRIPSMTALFLLSACTACTAHDVSTHEDAAVPLDSSHPTDADAPVDDATGYRDADVPLDATTHRDAAVPCGEFVCESNELCLDVACYGVDLGGCHDLADGGTWGNCPSYVCVPVSWCESGSCENCRDGSGGPAFIDWSMGVGDCLCG